jgi:hypothetical protein
VAQAASTGSSTASDYLNLGMFSNTNTRWVYPSMHIIRSTSWWCLHFSTVTGAELQVELLDDFECKIGGIAVFIRQGWHSRRRTSVLYTYLVKKPGQLGF